MALIGMCIHSTEENGRITWSEATLKCLAETVDFNKHRLGIINNASSERMCGIIDDFAKRFEVWFPDTDLIIIDHEENVGTARGHNSLMGLALGDSYIKIDDDLDIPYGGWVDEMVEAIKRDPSIGILGLKRYDLEQSPNAEKPQYLSTLEMLPREKGMSWIVAEFAEDIIGTCTMYNPKLIEKIGGLFQISNYSFDDYNYCQRSLLAGFRNAFLPHIPIFHLDDGQNPYIGWKQDEAGRVMEETMKIVQQYKSGERSLYVPIPKIQQ